MSAIADAVANIEAQINEEAEKRAVEKVAVVFAKVLLTISDGKTIDYDFWAKATIKAMAELKAEGKVSDDPKA